MPWPSSSVDRFFFYALIRQYNMFLLGLWHIILVCRWPLCVFENTESMHWIRFFFSRLATKSTGWYISTCTLSSTFLFYSFYSFKICCKNIYFEVNTSNYIGMYFGLAAPPVSFLPPSTRFFFLLLTSSCCFPKYASVLCDPWVWTWLVLECAQCQHLTESSWCSLHPSLSLHTLQVTSGKYEKWLSYAERTTHQNHKDILPLDFPVQSLHLISANLKWYAEQL